MIRRDCHEPNRPPAWVLISQIEHARLAGDLARHWGVGEVPPLTPYAEVLAAVYHHDDGWAEWEAAPQVDPQFERPLAFTEMPIAEALAIWRRSIDRCATYGPLAAWMVAGHFAALLRSAAFASSPAAGPWLAEFHARRADWLREALAHDASLSPADATTALRMLQIFDSLSLWFCCAERNEPTRVSVPGGPELEIVPAPAGSMRLQPWPLTVEKLTLSVVGQAIPVSCYPNAQSLAAAPHEPVSLTWQLHP